MLSSFLVEFGDGLQFEEGGGLHSVLYHILDLLVLLGKLVGNGPIFSILFYLVQKSNILQSFRTRCGSLSLLGRRGRLVLLSCVVLEFSPDFASTRLLVELNVRQIVGVPFTFYILEQAGLQQHICFEGIKQKQFETEVLEICFPVFLLELIFEEPLVLLRDEHEVLLLDVFVDDFNLGFGPFEDGSLHVLDVHVDSNFVVVVGVDEGGDVEDVVSDLSLLGLEEVVELEQAHHLAGTVVELDQDDALIFEQLSVVVVLLLTQVLVLAHILVVLLYVIVGDVSISEEVLNLEGIQFFLVLDDLHWASFSLFGDEGGG